jgi:S1-C subfamily serine protease
MDVTTIPQGTGSGFIWDNAGHVVTNFHVIKNASALKVTLYDSSSWPAKVVGYDETKDIAVLKLDMPDAEAKKLDKVSLGRSTGLAVGQKVFAIGNPFGLDHTLTSVRCAFSVAWQVDASVHSAHHRQNLNAGCLSFNQVQVVHAFRRSTHFSSLSVTQC